MSSATVGSGWSHVGQSISAVTCQLLLLCSGRMPLCQSISAVACHWSTPPDPFQDPAGRSATTRQQLKQTCTRSSLVRCVFYFFLCSSVPLVRFSPPLTLCLSLSLSLCRSLSCSVSLSSLPRSPSLHPSRLAACFVFCFCIPHFVPLLPRSQRSDSLVSIFVSVLLCLYWLLSLSVCLGLTDSS